MPLLTLKTVLLSKLEAQNEQKNRIVNNSLNGISHFCGLLQRASGNPQTLQRSKECPLRLAIGNTDVVIQSLYVF